MSAHTVSIVYGLLIAYGLIALLVLPAWLFRRK